ncbi:HTH-type transcriptional regulator GltC [wastewater metagenome]|uniref:HTH-type transcriptional regulator GltC n=4 Tax=root TaxID=1 RepID=A0A5B8RGQ8_9ZZZZ|nr:HTH-type transcriptional regulator GltC [uncultured organism]
MRQRTLDLRALQTLVTVADAGSFTTAARQLSYTQSAVSMQLRRLESELGITLLQRGPRTVQPTRQGQEVLGYAREMLRLNGEVWRRIEDREVAGTVRLGIPADYALYLPATLASFAEQYPRVEVEVRSELSETLVARVRAGEIDVAVVTRQPHSPGGTLLRREPLVWVGAPGSTAHAQDPLPLALYPEGTCEFRAAATSRLDDAGRPWRAAYVSQAFAALQSPVSVGLAVGVATPSMLGPGLTVLDPAETGLPALPGVEIALHRSTGRPSVATRRLTELIVSRLRDGSREPDPVA